MTIITPVPGIKLHDIRPEVPAFVAQVNIICRSYRLTASNTLAATKILSIYPKYLLIKNTSWKDQRQSFTANNIDNLCGVI